MYGGGRGGGAISGMAQQQRRGECEAGSGSMLARRSVPDLPCQPCSDELLCSFSNCICSLAYLFWQRHDWNMSAEQSRLEILLLTSSQVAGEPNGHEEKETGTGQGSKGRQASKTDRNKHVKKVLKFHLRALTVITLP